MSYTVAQSTRELGIRVALGAQPSDILKLVVGQGFVLVLVGAALGLAGALALTRLLAGLLYEVTATDPLALGSVALLLLVAALLACLIPAWRATRIDPLVALKCE
jgi:putative ABC transport system permease protein